MLKGKNIERQKRRKYKCGMLCVFGWMRESEELTHPAHARTLIHTYTHTLTLNRENLLQIIRKQRESRETPKN